MTDKSMNWMDQASGLFKQWAEHQQNVFRQLSAGAGPFATFGVAPPTMPGSLDEGVRQVQDLWRTSMEQWVALAQQALPQAGFSADALKALLDPTQWAHAGLGPLDAAIEHLVEGPSYATLWTLDRKLLRAQKLRTEWVKDLGAYQILMQRAWSEAVKRFLDEVNDTSGTPITNWRELTDLWIRAANETLLETHRTPEFLEAQRRLTRSGTECRLQEREIAEAFCEIQQMPTRTEMDEVQREVYELRRQLRELRKAGAAGQASAEPARAPTAQPPRKSARRKSSGTAERSR